MGTLSGDGYYQDMDEDAYYDSWEFERDEDRKRDVIRPDSYYRDKHVPAKTFLRNAFAESASRNAAEAQAAALGGRLSEDGKTILVPVMTETQKVEAKDRYLLAKATKVGETFECAFCGKSHVKTNYQQAFCPPINGRRGKKYVCKEKYHNSTNPVRASRANKWMGN